MPASSRQKFWTVKGRVKVRGVLRNSLRSRRLEVMDERENGRERETREG